MRNKYGLPPNLPVVLFVGRLVPKKGYDIVARAHSTSYHVVIVGGEKPVDMEEYTNVTFFEAMPPNILRDFYQLSDVFVFPAIGEILTLVMQEAMSCGLPVITAQDPGYASYDLNQDLIRFIARTPEALRSCLDEVLNNPDLMREMGTYSRRVAEERFDWKKNYDREMSIYGEAS